MQISHPFRLVSAEMTKAEKAARAGQAGQSAAPLMNTIRRSHYRFQNTTVGRQTSGFTPRQLRRLGHKRNRIALAATGAV